jgi:hypothetical protein
MNQVSHALSDRSERAEGGSVTRVHVGPDDKTERDVFKKLVALSLSQEGDPVPAEAAKPLSIKVISPP